MGSGLISMFVVFGAEFDVELAMLTASEMSYSSIDACQQYCPVAELMQARVM